METIAGYADGMNVVAGALLDPVAVAHENATDRVNAWRGRCLSSFARIEMAVSEALLTLSVQPGGVALPHMFGQRIAALRGATGVGSDAGEVIAALDAFVAHMPLRVFLTHGDARVTIGRDGGWQAVLTVLALKRGGGEHSFLVIDEDEAQRIARALGRDRQRLVTRLAQWRSAAAPMDKVGCLRVGGDSSA